MIHTDMPNKKIHQGRNIKRFREILGIKQDALAYELGEDWNQKKISLLEQKESVEKDILEQVAKILYQKKFQKITSNLYPTMAIQMKLFYVSLIWTKPVALVLISEILTTRHEQIY